MKTIDEIIELFKDIEDGKYGQPIGFHLHKTIKQADDQSWYTNDSYPSTFSGFLTALKEME